MQDGMELNTCTAETFLTSNTIFKTRNFKKAQKCDRQMH